jgi:hypothetical protein
MQNYTINKVVSIIAPIVFIVVVSLITPPPLSWSMLLVGVSLVGYTHYVLGAYYQQRAWKKRPTYLRYITFSFIIVGISAAMVVIAITYDAMWLIALVTIPYFVWHGYENEHTLYTRSTGEKLSPYLLMGISLIAVGLTIDAFRHSSALFATSLVYTSTLLPSTTKLFAFMSPFLFVAGMIGILLGIIFLLLSIKNNATIVGFGWLIVALGACVWFWYANPLPYIWLFVLLLGYHFVTWGVHYGVIFWPNSKAFYGYLVAHILVVFVVVVASYMVSKVIVQLPLGLLNTEVFLFMTLAHIGTSFLNETWARQSLRL